MGLLFGQLQVETARNPINAIGQQPYDKDVTQRGILFFGLSGGAKALANRIIIQESAVHLSFILFYGQ
jgi:hypothetical protein